MKKVREISSEEDQLTLTTIIIIIYYLFKVSVLI